MFKNMIIIIILFYQYHNLQINYEYHFIFLATNMKKTNPIKS